MMSPRSPAAKADGPGAARLGATAGAARWIVRARQDELPAPAIDAAQEAILDCVGVSIAAAGEPMGVIISDYVQSLGGAEQAGTLAGGRRTTAENAALVTGVLAHALDFDDTWAPGSSRQQTASHPSCSLIPVLVGLGQALGSTGPELVTAYVTGMQIHGKVGFPGWTTVRPGFHGSAVFGALGAAAAAAQLLRQDASQTAMTLSLAAAHAAGLNSNRGTMGKPYQVGNVAAGAVRAALLVDRGYTAAVDGIEGFHGFAHAILDSRLWDEARFVASLDESLSILDPGVEMKKYASCLFTHRALDATLQMMRTHDLSAGDVSAVEVIAPPASIVNRPGPSTGLEAKFSLQYTVAQAIRHGQVGYRMFADDQLRDQDLRALMRRVTVTEDPEITSDFPRTAVPVRICLDSGAVVADPVAIGDAGWCAPMSSAEVDAKYLDNTTARLGAQAAAGSLRLLRQLHRLADPGELFDLLTGAQPSAGSQSADAERKPADDRRQ
jgi:2-methylcitrate dehydratase PrpD